MVHGQMVIYTDTVVRSVAILEIVYVFNSLE